MQADKTSFLLQDFLNSEFLSDISIIHDPISAPVESNPEEYKYLAFAFQIIFIQSSSNSISSGQQVSQRAVLKKSASIKSMLMRNKLENIIQVILPINQDTSILKTFIKYLYTNQDNQLFQAISLSHAPTLFQLQTIAHELQCEKLKDSLQKYILEDYLTGATASGVLLHGIKLNDKDLIEAGKKILIQNFDNVLENEDQGSGIDALVKLPFDVFRQICTADVLNVKQEGSVVKAITQFIKKREQLPVIDEQKKEQAPAPSGQDQDAPEKEGDPPVEPPEGDDSKAEESQQAKFKVSEKQANESIHTLMNRFEERTNSIIFIECADQPILTSLSFLNKLDIHTYHIKHLFVSQPSHCLLLQRIMSYKDCQLAQNLIKGRHNKHQRLSKSVIQTQTSQQPRESYKLPRPTQSITHMEQENHDMEESKVIQHPTAPHSEHPARSTPRTVGDRTASLYHNQQNLLLPASHHVSPSQPQQQSQQSFYNKNKAFNLSIPNRGMTGGSSIFKQSIPRPPQKLTANTGQSGFPFGGPGGSSPQQQLPIYFEYQYDFDQNGALYYLGSYGRKRLWQNPHQIGQVRVLASSVGTGKVEDFVGRNAQNLRTMNQQSSFFGVDLGEGRLFTPSYYSIRNRKSTSHVMMNWKMEGSLDKVDWKTLDIRQHIFPPNSQFDDAEIRAEREALKISGATSTWGLDSNLVNDEAFRYFRIVQTYKNSSGSDNLALSGFELYGVAKAGRWH